MCFHFWNFSLNKNVDFMQKVKHFSSRNDEINVNLFWSMAMNKLMS